MKLWSILRGRNDGEITRYSLDEYAWQRKAAIIDFALSGGGTSPWLKTEDIENSFEGYARAAYKTNGVVFSVILARMRLFSEARFQWQNVRNGRPGDLFGTADLALLETPWPNGTTGDLLARAEQDVSLAGNFYVVREGDRLRRLRPDWVTIVLSAPPAEAVQSDIIGYWYHPGRTLSGLEPDPQDHLYPVDEVAHWAPIPDPEAQYRGMSWITPIIREIQADRAATEHKLKFFENGATLGPIISLKETVTPDAYREFVSEFKASHQGARQAYKPLFVGGGADVTPATATLQQLDFKATQGAGETRIAAAGGVPPIIVGLSEGLAASTYSNYSQARRAFGDSWARPQWRSVCAALATIVDLPANAQPGTVRLWYDDRDIAFLREDQQDGAQTAFIRAQTIRQYVDAGYEPDSVTAAVDADDLSLLKHSGLYSVQLLPPESVQTLPVRTEMTDLGKEADAKPAAQAAAEAAGAAEATGTAARADLHPGDAEELHRYWTKDPEGLAKWADSDDPWTELHRHLLKFLPPGEAERTASAWFEDVFHFAAGSDKNRVLHGHPPRGHLVGPG